MVAAGRGRRHAFDHVGMSVPCARRGRFSGLGLEYIDEQLASPRHLGSVTPVGASRKREDADRTADVGPRNSSTTSASFARGAIP
jgi:hypothetical protein